MPHVCRPRLTGRIDGGSLHESDIGNAHPVKRPARKNLYRAGAKL
ncbi:MULTISPECIES: hypothetical protein [Methylomonas]|nr:MULTISPECIES: hypothetical protein [Methylomonas]